MPCRAASKSASDAAAASVAAGAARAPAEGEGVEGPPLLLLLPTLWAALLGRPFLWPPGCCCCCCGVGSCQN